MSKSLKKGQTISLEDANTFIKHNILLNSFVETTLTGDYPPELDNDLDRYKIRKTNAYVFDRNTVERFFADGVDTKYIVVLVGAHTEPDEVVGPYPEQEDFKAGSYTVLLTGCKNVDPGKLDLEVVDIENPVTEYPPSLLKHTLVLNQERNEDPNLAQNKAPNGYFEILTSAKDLAFFENEVIDEYKSKMQI